MNFALLLLMAVSADIVPQNARDHIHNGLDYAYLEEYDSAFALFEKAVESSPTHPAGYFFLAYLCDLYNNDMLSDKYDDDFRQYSERVIQLCNLISEDDPVASNFFRGSMIFSQALNNAQRGNYLGALSLATPAYEELKKAFDAENSLHDAELGIGAYLFLRGKLETTIFGGNRLRDEGIMKIKNCAENGEYLDIAAKNLLSLLYLEMGKKHEAIATIMELINIYPSNRTFHWALLKCYLKTGDNEKIVETGLKLVTLINDGPEIPPGNLANVYYHIAQAYYNLDEKDKAEEYCLKVLNLPLDDYTRDFKKKAQDLARRI
ncbi:tetratricopeptide repeat protein [candidate division WOR-3 bacterium]|nr:tetratricopeptide repeat protein [candidate division WOR-3 bacterium]